MAAPLGGAVKCNTKMADTSDPGRQGKAYNGFANHTCLVGLGSYHGLTPSLNKEQTVCRPPMKRFSHEPVWFFGARAKRPCSQNQPTQFGVTGFLDPPHLRQFAPMSKI
jgi:hypothetical protein